MKTRLIVLVAGVAMSLIVAFAQEGGDQQGLPGGGKPPAPPIEAALDSNGDGILDAEEIANASVALRKLDKNGDGILSADEWKPAMPARGARMRP